MSRGHVAALKWGVITESSRRAVQLFLSIVATVISVSAADERPSVREQLMNLKMVNYYPAHAARTNMWTRWDPAAVDQDLAAMASVHANAVRIAVFTSTGYPEPAPAMLDHLREFVGLADKHGLKVKLALFGFFGSYRDIDGSIKWAEAVLNGYKNDHRIAYIDLQNEIARKNPDAFSWAAQLLPHIHAAAGDIPVTVSMSGGAMPPDFVPLKEALKAPTASGSLVDFFEMHCYGRPANAYKMMTEVRDIVAPIPLYVGEFGCSTYPDARRANHIAGEPWWEAYQDQQYRTVLYAAKSAGMPPPAPWMFCDLAPEAWPPPANKPQPWPWSDARTGFFTADRKPKLAASTISRYFSAGTVDLTFNNGFEAADSSSLPLNWAIRSPTKARFARDTTVKHSGAASASISQSLPDPKGYPAFTVTPVHYVQPGHSYRASVWVRGRGVTGTARMELTWLEPYGQVVGNTLSPTVPHGASEWTELTVNATAPATAGLVEIELGCYGNRGTVWFDDVKFE